MGPFLLLVAAVMARTSSVFADDYLFQKECDGIIRRRTWRCYLDEYDREPKNFGYYKLELIQDRTPSGYGCRTSSYSFEVHNKRLAITVTRHCKGLFGLKVRNPGIPYNGSCGQDNGLGFKIINGNETLTDCKFPWMAYVYKDWDSRQERSACGGSIVGNKWILTAAHCIISQFKDGRVPPASAMVVRTGSLDKWANYIQRRVDRILIHHDYSWKYLDDDIALLRLAKPIKYDSCHSPVCLNPNMTSATDKKCFLSGWGRTRVTGNYWPRKLQWTRETIYSRSKCKGIYKGESSASTICTRSTAGGHSGFCAGDSGGPLVCQEDDDGGRYYQHGIVSRYYGYKYCKMEGLYTRVAYYYDWIQHYIK